MITNDLPSSLITQSGTLSDKSAILNCFNDHFISAGSLFESLNPELTNIGLASVNTSLTSRAVSGPITCPFEFMSVSVSEVHNALKKLDTSKAAGPDQIVPFLLKLAADFIAEPLSQIFNLSLISKNIPKISKSAFVTPLLKGGEPTNVNNYRPISKLCILAKLFERIISDQLKEFLESNNILSLQSGFRKQHSTITAALKVLNDLIEAMDSKKYCVALFIDLSKAFDTNFTSHWFI